MLIFFVKDGRKFRFIAVLEIRPWIKRQRLNERTACLNGKFLKDFHFSVLLYSLKVGYSIYRSFMLLQYNKLSRYNNQALQEHKIK